MHDVEGMPGMRLLLLLQVDLKTSNGSTALHNAANCGHAAVVKQLLQAGAGVGQCALTGANALFNAATAGTTLLPLLPCMPVFTSHGC